MALCSANLRLSKSFEIGGVLAPNEDFNREPRLNDELDFGLTPVFDDFEEKLFFEKLLFGFSITTEFLLLVFAISILFIDFFAVPEIVNFVFLFSITHHSIFIYNFSCRHN